MKKLALLAVFAGALALAGCNDQKTAEAPPPAVELTTSAVGHYCGMNVLEHSGPKGQIILASRKEPVWFSSARDTVVHNAAGGTEGHPGHLRVGHGQSPVLGEAGRNELGRREAGDVRDRQPHERRHGRR